MATVIQYWTKSVSLCKINTFIQVLLCAKAAAFTFRRPHSGLLSRALVWMSVTWSLFAFCYKFHEAWADLLGLVFRLWKRFRFVQVRLLQVKSYWGQGSFPMTHKGKKKIPAVMTSVGFLCFTLAQLEEIWDFQADRSLVCVLAKLVQVSSPTRAQQVQNGIRKYCICSTYPVQFVFFCLTSLARPESIRLLRIFIPKSIRLGVHMLHNITIKTNQGNYPETGKPWWCF